MARTRGVAEGRGRAGRAWLPARAAAAFFFAVGRRPGLDPVFAVFFTFFMVSRPSWSEGSRVARAPVDDAGGLSLGARDLADGHATDLRGETQEVSELAAKAGEVVGRVADERESLAGEGGDHHLPRLAVRPGCPGVGVHDLWQVVIVPDVDPVARLAVDPHARPARLRHPDDVEGADAHLPLDARPQLLRPHLGAEDGHTEP